MTTKILLQSNENQTSAIPSTNEARNGAGELNAAHTPGPWIVRPSDTDDAFDVMTEDGFYVAQAFEMYGPNDEVVTLANAHLIAATPDLFDACKSAQATFKTMALRGERTPLSQIKATVDALSAALALANGQQKESNND